MEGTVNCKMFWRRIGQSLVKLKLIKACKQAITFLDIYPKSGKCTCAQDTWIRMFTAVLFTLAKLWKQPQHSAI